MEDNQATPSDKSNMIQRTRPTKRTLLFCLIVVISMVALDQWTKHWAQTDLQFREGRTIVFKEKLAAFTYVRNPGAAWGFLSGKSLSFRQPFFVTVSIVAMTFIAFLFSRLQRSQYFLAWAYAFVFAGAIGNFIDRVRLTYVIDFLDFYVGSYRWPTFNVADVSISIGVGFLIIDLIWGPKELYQKPSSD